MYLAQTRDADFAKLADGYFHDLWFHYNPARGTASGFHQYDALMPTFSRAEIQALTAALRKCETATRNFEPLGLSPAATADRELLLAKIQGQLLALESSREWEKNPDLYSSYATNATFMLMSRSFAPAAERLKSVIARERQIPRLFQSACENLNNPPRIYTEMAIEQLPGIAAFFQNDVPAAFKSVIDAQLQAEFKAANDAVIAAVNSYQGYLKTDVLPRSNGDFRIGEENYTKKLCYEEMVETPLHKLLDIGYENLRLNQTEFKSIAAKIDPKRTPQQTLEELERDHPAPDKLLEVFRGTLEGLRDYITQHRIMTIPSQAPPIVEQTPPLARATMLASLDIPGLFQNAGQEPFLNVTLPEPDWSAQHVDEHMADFNRGDLLNIAIHEVYGGHYVQFLWVKDVPSKVRKLIGCGSNTEGWAHYNEQMILDEGYGNGDLKLRLSQLQNALLRDARYIVGIQMHTGKMTYDQAIDFFENEAYQTHANSARESKRGTIDPTYLHYTLGKLQILKLRDDYKQMMGEQFSLEEFHNSFMKQGFPPIKIVRRAMLGNDSPVL
jgi:uncharacterized protein (DUF885 family)